MLDEQLQLLARLIGVVLAAGVLFGIRELFWLRRIRKLGKPELREMGLSLSPIIPNSATHYLMLPVWAAIYEWVSRIHVHDVTWSMWPVPLAILAADFSYYLEHRCAHKIRVFWSLYHAVHHSSGALTIATAFRVSFLNHFIAPVFYLPWVIIGMNPLLVMAAQLLVFHYQAWVHTEMIGQVPWLDPWLNTPANHRMHHSSSVAHRDCNFGGILILWDKLFGTYKSPEDDLQYGITDMIPPENVLEMYVSPLRAK